MRNVRVYGLCPKRKVQGLTVYSVQRGNPVAEINREKFNYSESSQECGVHGVLLGFVAWRVLLPL